MPDPRVSILMPVYNGQRYLRQAVESVLAQSFGDYELLIVDDGSTDSTLEILYSFARADRRIQIYKQQHQGTRAALNRGLDISTGHYLARLDADDIALPNRLYRQVSYMDACSELVICGSNYEVIDEHGNRLSLARMPENDTHIRWHCLFHSPFATSTVMLRLDALRHHGLRYAHHAVHVEDYELWSRLLQYGKAANLPEPLICWRQHPQQVTQTGKSAQWANASQVTQRNLARLGLELPLDQVSLLRTWYYAYPKAYNREDIPVCQALMHTLQAFCAQTGLEKRELTRIRGRWLLKMLLTPCASGVGCSWKRPMWSSVRLRDVCAISAYLVYRKRLLKMRGMFDD